MKSKEIIKVYMKDLSKTSKTPIFTWCRNMLKKGVDTDSEAHFYRKDRLEPDVIIPNVGRAALITVQEDRHLGPRFVKFRERDHGSAA